MQDIRTLLKRVTQKTNHFAEFRYHARTTRVISVQKAELTQMSSKHYEGVGIRVLVNGTWGFASTALLTEDALTEALHSAEQLARELESRKKRKVVLAKNSQLAKGDFIVPGFQELMNLPLEEKLRTVWDTEERLRKSAQTDLAKIESAQCEYLEYLENKIIVTTDGADAQVAMARPQLKLTAIGSDGTKKSYGRMSTGVTGPWNCLFTQHSLEESIDLTIRNARDLLTAPPAEGGKKHVILSPAMVGLLSHEAIGHTVEADFVSAGSAVQGRMGEMIGSPLVTLVDSGKSEYVDFASGILPVDDEGVLTQKTEIIKDGKLVSYLHNRESAAHYGVAPTGNARAWVFDDEPLIRMRNTYIAPGKSKLSSMISEIDDGYFIDGAGGGQADATAEFMFGANRVRRIRNGKLAEAVGEVTVSGNAFEVLKSVDAVSDEFHWDLGSGHCGKGQPAKVDAGGPYIRCHLMLGGKQS